MAKKRTARQKREEAAVRKELKDAGLLPPDKKPLNRKKFLEETGKIWEGREAIWTWDLYLTQAAYWMMEHPEKACGTRKSLEAVGAAKVLRMAVEIQQLHKRKRQAGEPVTLLDEHRAVQEIFKM